MVGTVEIDEKYRAVFMELVRSHGQIPSPRSRVERELTVFQVFTSRTSGSG